MTPVSFIVTAFIQFTLYHFHKDFFFLISESFRSMLLNVQTCFSFSFSFFFFFLRSNMFSSKGHVMILPEPVMVILCLCLGLVEERAMIYK